MQTLQNIGDQIRRCALASLMVYLFGTAPAVGQELDIANMSAEQLLEQTKSGQEFPAAQQVELARTAVEKVEAEGRRDLASTACLNLAMALYLNTQLADALQSVDSCLADSVNSDPSIHLRLRSLQAGLWLLTGDLERSLAEYERLIAAKHTGVDQVTLLRLRSNYGGALLENGQVLRAIEEIQAVIQAGIEIEHDFTVLGNTNNLLVLLIEQRMYQDAVAWIDRIRPVMARSDAKFYVESIRLHEMNLEIHLGDPAKAADQLRAFVLEDLSSGNIEGHGYEELARALLATGDLAGARIAAERAVELLSGAPLEAADARFALSDVLIKQGEYVQAEKILQVIATSPLLPPIRQEQLLSMEIENELARSRQTALLDKFRTLSEQREQRERTVVEQNARYFDVKAEALEQAEQIRRIDASREVLAARAAASAAEASESAAVAEAARKQQIFTVAIIGLIASLVVLGGVGIAQRRFDRKLRERQRELNQQLTVQVEEKSKALKAQLNEQAELERVVADKAQVEALGQLTGNVAHDFNNLLQVMSIANENMEHLEKTNFQASLLEGSNRALDHAKSIIRQLLSYARRQTLAAETLRVSDYLQNTRTLLSAAIDARVNFTIDDQSDGALISVDRSQLTTSLLNLLGNSCDAMQDGGELTLSVGMSNCWESPAEPVPCVELCVEDTGVGMTASELEHAFEPFFTTKAEDYGTGLGLSSVHGFVQQSGGNIKIASDPGQGTRVTLQFPIAEGQASGVSPEREQREGMNGLNVLLVEDNPILAKALEAMIVHLGAKVEHQPSGDQAARRLDDAHGFDIVISDVRMPGKLDGFALAKWTHSNHPQLPVLLMSGYNESVDGGEKVMSKPFTQADLLEHVQTLVA